VAVGNNHRPRLAATKAINDAQKGAKKTRKGTYPNVNISAFGVVAAGSSVSRSSSWPDELLGLFTHHRLHEAICLAALVIGSTPPVWALGDCCAVKTTFSECLEAFW
jgi:hypothetical protein